MSTCRTCTHWREFDLAWDKHEKSGGGGWGQCGIIRSAYTGNPRRRGLAHISTAHGGNPGLTTAADFGCVEHEAKP